VAGFACPSPGEHGARRSKAILQVPRGVWLAGWLDHTISLPSDYELAFLLGQFPNSDGHETRRDQTSPSLFSSCILSTES
jgi:hypothetical protein